MITLAELFPPVSALPVKGDAGRHGLDLLPGDAFLLLFNAWGEEKKSHLRSSSAR